jgi:hypothetical protein
MSILPFTLPKYYIDKIDRLETLVTHLTGIVLKLQEEVLLLQQDKNANQKIPQEKTEPKIITQKDLDQFIQVMTSQIACEYFFHIFKKYGETEISLKSDTAQEFTFSVSDNDIISKSPKKFLIIFWPKSKSGKIKEWCSFELEYGPMTSKITEANMPCDKVKRLWELFEMEMKEFIPLVW